EGAAHAEAHGHRALALEAEVEAVDAVDDLRAVRLGALAEALSEEAHVALPHGGLVDAGAVRPARAEEQARAAARADLGRLGDREPGEVEVLREHGVAPMRAASLGLGASLEHHHAEPDLGEGLGRVDAGRAGADHHRVDLAARRRIDHPRTILQARTGSMVTVPKA